MKRTIFILAFLFVSNVSFAQVRVPNYQDMSQWRYKECDVTYVIEGTDNIVFHEDYEPLTRANDNAFLAVIYKPVDRDLLEESDEKFVDESKQQPWLLIYSDDSDHKPIYLFEYVNNDWRLEKTFNNELELDKFMIDKYKLR